MIDSRSITDKPVPGIVSRKARLSDDYVLAIGRAAAITEARELTIDFKAARLRNFDSLHCFVVISMCQELALSAW